MSKPGPKPKDTCKWGHSMTGDNVRWTKRQGRIERGCVACNRMRNHKKREQRKTLRHEQKRAHEIATNQPVDPRVLLCRKEWALRSQRLLARWGPRVAA